MSDPLLQARVVELESRLAFQEQASAQLSDALAALRMEAARNGELLRRVVDELKAVRGAGVAIDAADEPPPPHY